ncbi:MAG TPA: lysylphosphatidylglycerol synthase transmembrane domain-containing protein [Bacteroidales bacterium]|nr:lysylphosphatidylglycerol synthase transmembrane domain-containing protein [Bacteroidales bacterium]
MADIDKIRKFFSFKRIILPIIFGGVVAIWLINNTFNSEIINNIVWSWKTIFWLIIALLLMCVRDLAYIIRIRLLTNKQLTWRRSFITIMLWEFASSITPSVVGGSAIALYILNKENINMGRATAIVMVTTLLDELFYIIMVPLIFLIVGYKTVFASGNFFIGRYSYSSEWLFVIGYIFIIILTCIIIYGIFVNPRSFKYLLLMIFKLPFLKRWRSNMVKVGDDIITTSAEMKRKSLIFWLKAFLSTFFSWTARYWVVNSLIMAFIPVADNMLLYAKQLIMWIILLISPTPGSSGIAEFVFADFLKEFIAPGLEGVLALLWRLISYYPYIIIGLIILPGWLRKIYIAQTKTHKILQ